MSGAAALPEGVTSPVAEYVTSTLSANPANTDINANYVLQSGYLVFFMHCGFAMLSIGCVRAKFAKHIAILILLDACASALGFYLFGYAFAFGDPLIPGPDGSTLVTGGNAFIGSQFFALHNFDANQLYLWLFQWSFAATACTIVSGAIAERARFESYILYSLFMSSWVYPVVVHSIWSGAGWASSFRTSPYWSSLLIQSGAIDFAGSGAVHMVGGFAAICGCFILGPRIGRFLPDGTVVDMAGHNTSLFVLGVLILWFGWYGFNPGSQLVLIGGSRAIANAAVNTTLAAASAGLSGLLFKCLLLRFETGRMVYDLMTMGNATLAGLVAITSGCSVVYPWGAIIIGGCAGVVYCLASKLSILLRLDDPLDAIAVHAFNGVWGVLAVGFFAGATPVTLSYGLKPNCTVTDTNDCQREYGCFLGGSGRLLAAQIVYSLWIMGWVIGNMLPFFFILHKLGLFRVNPNDETVGLDDSYHGGSAYPGGPEEAAMARDMPNGAANGKPAQPGELERLKRELAEIKAHVMPSAHFAGANV